jgi:signal peptidase II
VNLAKAPVTGRYASSPASSSPSGSGSSGAARSRRSAFRRGALAIAIASAVIALDQWSKSWAQQYLSITDRRHVVGPIYLFLTFNRGAAFSLGSGASPVIEAIAIGLVVVVVVFSGRLAKGGAHPAVIVGLALLAGGALSNLADRLFRHHSGAVVDFVQAVNWWPTFNVADAAITVGAVIAGIALVFAPRARDEAEGEQWAPGPGPGTGPNGSDGPAPGHNASSGLPRDVPSPEWGRGLASRRSRRPGLTSSGGGPEQS